MVCSYGNPNPAFELPTKANRDEFLSKGEDWSAIQIFFSDPGVLEFRINKGAHLTKMDI